MHEILVPIVLFLCTTAVLVVYFVTRHNERRAFIEKGITPAELRNFAAVRGETKPLSNLKWGLLGIFIGIGLIIGGWLYEAYHMEEYIYFACMLVSGGIGLVIFYFVASKKLEKAA